jgi:hypothetical protein
MRGGCTGPRVSVIMWRRRLAHGCCWRCAGRPAAGRRGPSWLRSSAWMWSKRRQRRAGCCRCRIRWSRRRPGRGDARMCRPRRCRGGWPACPLRWRPARCRVRRRWMTGRAAAPWGSSGVPGQPHGRDHARTGHGSGHEDLMGQAVRRGARVRARPAQRLGRHPEPGAAHAAARLGARPVHHCRRPGRRCRCAHGLGAGWPDGHLGRRAARRARR